MIPFNRPEFQGDEALYLARALENGALGGHFTNACKRWLVAECGAEHVHLVQSATAGLELAALLCDFAPGDEVIMPSFTFVACANAMALRGAVPVFVDIDPRTLNLDPSAVEAALTDRTRAILAVHYAGVPCEMGALRALADHHGLVLIEDAAQALLASAQGRPAGSLGDIGIFSFHQTKNITCGEGGAVLINAPRLAASTEIMHQHGTNRSALLLGEVDRYRWLSLGSSFAPSDITAAVLLAQFERAHSITDQRRAIWDRYHAAFQDLEKAGRLRRPIIPFDVNHNAHIYYLLLESEVDRNHFIECLRTQGISATFHYVPLHYSPGGLRYGRSGGPLSVTEDFAGRLVRLPLWPGMAPMQDQVIEAALHALSEDK